MKFNRFINKYYPAFLLLTFYLTVSYSILFEYQIVIAKETDSNTIKFVQITDVHFDKKSKNKKARLYKHSVELFDDAIKIINSIEDIDFVIFTGDVVNLPKRDDLKDFLTTANKLKPPYYVLAGNHDIGVRGGTSKKDFVEIINKYSKNQRIDKTYFSFEPNKNFKVIALDGVISDRISANGYYGLKQTQWLNDELDTNKKVIIASHFPIIEPIRSPSHVTINPNSILKLLNKNVVAFLSGHYHISKTTLKNNIVHISTPALVEYPNSIRIIKITKLNNNKISIETKLIPTNLQNLQEKSRKLKKAVKNSNCFKQKAYIIGETQ